LLHVLISSRRPGLPADAAAAAACVWRFVIGVPVIDGGLVHGPLNQDLEGCGWLQPQAKAAAGRVSFRGVVV